MKIFSTLILSYLDILYREKIHSEDHVDEECLIFMLSCILSSILLTCERLGYSASSIPFKQPLFPFLSQEGIGDANALSCGLLWLTCIVEKVNALLYQNTSENCSRVSKLLKAFDHFIPRALRVSAKCLKTIPSCIGDEATLGTSYRLALSLFRGTNHSFLIRHQIQSISRTGINLMQANGGSCDENILRTGVVNESEDLFGGINDDALMAIDLDNMIGTNNSVEEAKKSPNVDDLGYSHVWKLLSDSLRAAKVSPSATAVIFLPLHVVLAHHYLLAFNKICHQQYVTPKCKLQY